MKRLMPALHCWLLIGAVVVFLGLASPGWAAGLFGYMEFKANKISSIPKWVEVLSKIDAEESVLANCVAGERKCPEQALREWGRFVRNTQGQSKRAQMVTVNSYLNKKNYITDDQLYGVSDKWATPREFLRFSGDCEDYAIAKYFTLKVLGWNDADLRLVVVHDAVRNIPHAVLSVRLLVDGKSEFYILDNLATEPIADKYITQYTPYYAVNTTSRWIFLKPTAPAAGP